MLRSLVINNHFLVANSHCGPVSNLVVQLEFLLSSAYVHRRSVDIIIAGRKDNIDVLYTDFKMYSSLPL